MQTAINNENINNTVYSNYTVNTKVNEIRLLFSSPKLHDKILVIIEGTTDKIYKYLLDDKKVYIKANNSCDGLISLITILNKDFSDLIIVLKDADFDNLNNVSYKEYGNIFLTDTHDIETMMLSSENVECKLSMEFLSGSERGFINNCITKLDALSYMKWFNMTNHINLITKDIKMGNLFDGNSKISLNDCESEMFKNPKNQERCPNLLNEVQSFMKTHKTQDKWNLVNGHDLCNALAIYFQKKGSKSGNVSQCIRMAYLMVDFNQTKLYRQLTQWEITHNREIMNRNCI